VTNQPNTATLMFIAHRHAEARILAHLAKHGFDDLTPAQARVAARLGPAGIRLTTLAESAGLSKQTAAHLVSQLERAGYVDRVPDEHDARAKLIRIAARGQAAQRCAREMEVEIETEWRDRLGRERYVSLREALVDLRTITDPYI
jgi:DNA-binding MarR family transcriptional regulator